MPNRTGVDEQFFYVLITDQHNITTRTESRTNPQQRFEVNLWKLSCTCPKFKAQRTRYPARDIRRVCAHIHQVLQNAGIDKQQPPAVRIVLRDGRKYFDFYRVATRDIDMIFAFDRRSPWIRVFAVINHEEIDAEFHLPDQRWDRRRAPNHEILLREHIAAIFTASDE